MVYTATLTLKFFVRVLIPNVSEKNILMETRKRNLFYDIRNGRFIITALNRNLVLKPYIGKTGSLSGTTQKRFERRTVLITRNHLWKSYTLLFPCIDMPAIHQPVPVTVFPILPKFEWDGLSKFYDVSVNETST